MGYSCTQAAHLTLQRTINKANGRNINEIAFGNTWKRGNDTFFYERGRENDDGRITATVVRMIDANHCQTFGRIHITPSGYIRR